MLRQKHCAALHRIELRFSIDAKTCTSVRPCEQSKHSNCLRGEKVYNECKIKFLVVQSKTEAHVQSVCITLNLSSCLVLMIFSLKLYVLKHEQHVLKDSTGLDEMGSSFNHRKKKYKKETINKKQIITVFSHLPRHSSSASLIIRAGYQSKILYDTKVDTIWYQNFKFDHNLVR